MPGGKALIAARVPTFAVALAIGIAGAAATGEAAAAKPSQGSPEGTGDGLSLSRIYSDPRLDGVPSREIAWSPAGPKVAYLWSDKGRQARDLWVYDAPAGAALKLTDVQALGVPPEATKEQARDEVTAERRETMRLVDEGVDAFRWAPDGNSILFSFQSDLFIVGVKGGAPRRLTRTAAAEFDPQISPDGSRIAFVRDGNLWVISLAGGEIVQATVDGSDTLLNGLSDYISLEELNRFSAYTWSADSRYLVYVQADTTLVPELEIPNFLSPRVTHVKQRRPPAGEANSRTRIGVVAAGGGATRWIPLREGLEEFYVPKLERVGERIAVMQEERSLHKAWLYLIDPAEAKAKVVLEEKDDAWINLDRAYLGFDDETRTLLYGSERSGWGHLYAVDAASGALTSVTSGTWEVTALDRVAAGRVHFTATASGPAERHLYRTTLTGRGSDGRRPERITTKPGWHEAKISSDGAWVADIFQDVDTPPDLYVGKAGSKEPARVTTSPAKEFASLGLPAPEFMEITSRADGVKVPATLIRPTSSSPRGALSRGGKHPAIVRVHGAGYAQSIRRAWGGTSYLFHSILARQGYYVLDVDYRGSSGYGRKWRTDVYLHLGGLDLQDSLSGADYLRTLPDVDPNRIAIWGWSYGGFLTNMAMLAAPDVFNAGVAVAPVNDWTSYDTHYTEERLGRPQDQPEAYKMSSPMTYAEGLKRPLLMIHGLRDDNVHAQDTIRLVDALVKAGKDFDLMLYPEGKHGITRDASRVHLFSKVTAFLAAKMPPTK